MALSCGVQARSAVEVMRGVAEGMVKGWWWWCGEWERSCTAIEGAGVGFIVLVVWAVQVLESMDRQCEAPSAAGWRG